MNRFIFTFILLNIFSIQNCQTISEEDATCSNDRSNPEHHGTCYKKCIEFNPNGPSVIVKESTGRLGNQMFTYATLISLKLRFNSSVYLSKKSYNMLNRYFAGIKVKPAENELCGFEDVFRNLNAITRQRKLEKIESMMRSIIGDNIQLSRDNTGKVVLPPETLPAHRAEIEKIVHKPEFNEIEMPEILQNTSYPWQSYMGTAEALRDNYENVDYTHGKALILISPSPRDLNYIQETEGLEEALDLDFKFHAKYQQSAEKSLLEVIEKHKKKLKKKKNKKKKSESQKDFTFVGIHSRRTDHLAMDNVEGLAPLKPSYYLEAMDIFRNAYKNVIFVYVSDDIDWGKQSVGSRTTSAGDVYFVGGSGVDNDDSIGHDLALLSLCNHTIISHGTFSFWAGFLAGGKVVTPYHFPNLRPKNKVFSGYKGHPLKNPLKRLHYQ